MGVGARSSSAKTMTAYEERWAAHQRNVAWQQRTSEFCRHVSKVIDFHSRPFYWRSLPDGLYAVFSRANDQVPLATFTKPREAIQTVEQAMKGR